MKDFKPFHTLLFLLSTFGLLALTAFVFPANGIAIGELKLNFPTLSSFLFKPETKKPDISRIVALADAEDKISEDKNDTTAEKEVEKIEADSTVRLITSIQYKNNERGALDNFFESLENVNKEESIRILHYGDSQIEGDRISDYLRLKLQNQFGGSGPGFISPMPVAPSVALKQSWSPSWERYTIFTGKDKRVKHSNFGVGGSFCRFTDYRSISDSAKIVDAWLKVSTNKNGGPKLANYSKVKLFYAGAKHKTQVEFYENGTLKDADSLNNSGNFNIKQFSLNQMPNTFELKFKGKDSPDIFGLSLEGNGGVMVDNFGLRGSSGTFFNQMNLSHLKLFYDHFNARLIILQFGGNSLPYIKDKTECDNFGRYLQSQIISIKKLVPDASILVVGPADMSVKEGTDYVTHPQLENLRNAIRLAAFNTNSAFFDMYDCMGGKNSMVSWVEAGIAAKDYIHFSSGGARKIATLLYTSLINDYNLYTSGGKKATPSK
ncbi:MAG: hypothetical protein ACJ76F_01405 [Bacteroidia bacterium]